MTRCSQSLDSSISCCFGGAFCSFCCSTCPPCKGSTSTRVAFGLFLLVPVLLSCLMLMPGLDVPLPQLPSAFTSNDTFDECANPRGSFAVYRISFAMAMFFSVFCLIVSRNRVERRCNTSFSPLSLSLSDEQRENVRGKTREDSKWILGGETSARSRRDHRRLFPSRQSIRSDF